MGRSEAYRERLRELTEWELFLLEESRLPGPRGNLELLHAVADEGSTARFMALVDHTAEEAPSGTPGEFLVACGAAGLGERIAQGEAALCPTLRELASDSRWRVREGVAMGLQRIGDRDMRGLLRELGAWLEGGPLERRAVVAGLCEPRLLAKAAHARAVIDALDRITATLAAEPDRRKDEVRVLRQALGYGWSVAIVASPEAGKERFESWARSEDPDIRWVVRENLKKKRLLKLDAVWVDEMKRRVERAGTHGG